MPSPRDPRRRRVLVLIPGRLGPRMGGPEIRAWEFARALAGEHDVTAIVHEPDDREVDGVRLVAWSRGRILREALRHDAIISHCLPPYLMALKAVRPLTAISDQYDPIELELATLPEDDDWARRERRMALGVRRLQLRHADAILCAGDGQRAALLAELARAGRAPGTEIRPVVVPFGIAPPPAEAAGRPLRERFTQIGEDDRVVLWWGSVWRWFDAPAAVRAMASIRARGREDVKLVITAGRNPHQDTERFAATEEARAVARELGVLDETVLFLDDWVAFERRHEVLLEADLGLTLHRDTPEALLAARARYMDYLWAGLPCVLTRGDDVATMFGARGFARLLGPGDAGAAADAILELLDDPHALTTARDAGSALADELRWPAVTDALRAAMRAAPPARRTGPRETLAVWRATLAYYAGRAGDGAAELQTRRSLSTQEAGVLAR